jgi:hypothetical protein
VTGATKPLEGRVALVTGASLGAQRGVGAAKAASRAVRSSADAAIEPPTGALKSASATVRWGSTE